MDQHEELLFDALKKRDCIDKDKWRTFVVACESVTAIVAIIIFIEYDTLAYDADLIWELLQLLMHALGYPAICMHDTYNL